MLCAAQAPDFLLAFAISMLFRHLVSLLLSRGTAQILTQLLSQIAAIFEPNLSYFHQIQLQSDSSKGNFGTNVTIFSGIVLRAW